MKILVIQTAFIGDVILGTAVPEKLRRFYPGASIDMLVQKGNEVLFKGHPYIRKVLVFDKKESRLRSLAAVITEVRKERYEAVINLHRFLSSGIITVMSRARQKIGFDKNPLSWLFTRRIIHEISATGGLHEVQRNLALITGLTDDDLSGKPVLYPPPFRSDQIRTDVPYVCIAPASVWFTKQWPAEKWIACLRLIPGHLPIYLIGSKQDERLCKDIADAVEGKSIEILAGKLSLLESAALMQKAVMNFVNDSAPMHLASAVNAPVTVVFCSTVPAFGFGPLSEHSHVVETAHVLDCRPCGLHGYGACPQGHFKCADVDPARVAACLG